MPYINTERFLSCPPRPSAVPTRPFILPQNKHKHLLHTIVYLSPPRLISLINTHVPQNQMQPTHTEHNAQTKLLQLFTIHNIRSSHAETTHVLTAIALLIPSPFCRYT